MAGVKCPDCPNCPYFIRATAYGYEAVRCANTDCPLYTIREDEEADDVKD